MRSYRRAGIKEKDFKLWLDNAATSKKKFDYAIIYLSE
jgi:hypothetical protein